MSRAVVWTERMVEQLTKLHAQGLKYEEIAERLGITKFAVNSKASKMGLHRYTKQPEFTDADDQFLLANRNKLTLHALAKAMGRNREAVRIRILELTNNKTSKTLNREQAQWLIDNYADTETRELCKHLRCEPWLIRMYAERHKLRKSEAFVAALRKKYELQTREKLYGK